MAVQDSQTTRTVLRRLEKAEFLASSSRNQKKEVNSRLGFFYQDLASQAGNEPQTQEDVLVPDWDSFQQTNIRMLALADIKLKNSDLAYRIARAVLKAGSKERPDHLGTLRRYYSDLKVLLEVTYGAEYLYLLALESRQATSRVGVREQLLDVHGRITDADQLSQLPAPKSGRKALEFGDIAADLKAVLDRFESYLEEQKNRLKAKQVASIDRQEARDFHDRLYANVGRIQEGLYRLAGLDELADRIRVRLRRSSPTGEADKTSETDEPDNTNDPNDPNDTGVSPQPSGSPGQSV